MKVNFDLGTLSAAALNLLIRGTSENKPRKLPVVWVVNCALRGELAARQRHLDSGIHEQIDLVLPAVNGSEVSQAFELLANDVVSLRLARELATPESQEYTDLESAESFLTAILRTLKRQAQDLSRATA